MGDSGLSFEDKLRFNLSEDELVKLICDNARHTNPTYAYRYVEFLINRYGFGENNIGRIESGFTGLEKDSLDDWDVEE